MLDVVAIDVWSWVEEDDSISIVDNFVLDDPGKATFDDKDAFGTTLSDNIINDDSVGAGRSSKSQIGLVILRDQVFLDMSVCRFNKQDTLSEVQHDSVV